MSPDELLAEIGALASSLGPAVRPAGTEELLRSLTETARRLFGAAACSLALLTDDDSELLYTVAAAAGGEGLADALRLAADGLPPADADLVALPTSFAALARRGAAERRLALAVLRDVGDYAERRSPRLR
jgi:GAF domain-containing protein